VLKTFTFLSIFFFSISLKPLLSQSLPLTFFLFLFSFLLWTFEVRAQSPKGLCIWIHHVEDLKEQELVSSVPGEVREVGSRLRERYIRTTQPQREKSE
jgi:hypothetical protein